MPLPEDLNLTAEQRRAALNLYSAEWEKYIEAKRQKDKAAEEEMQRIQVSCCCCCCCCSCCCGFCRYFSFCCCCCCFCCYLLLLLLLLLLSLTLFCVEVLISFQAFPFVVIPCRLSLCTLVCYLFIYLFIICLFEGGEATPGSGKKEGAANCMDSGGAVSSSEGPAEISGGHFASLASSSSFRRDEDAGGGLSLRF